MNKNHPPLKLIAYNKEELKFLDLTKQEYLYFISSMFSCSQYAIAEK